MLPVILGLSGLALTDAERGLIRDADPAGFILFGRNVRDKAQLRALTDSLRELSGRADLPILVDQEGGRVARLGAPTWPAFPAPWRFAELYAKAPISAIEAARVNAQAIAVILAEAGINVDCTPSLDVAQADAHDVIGDRALGAEPMQVAALGRAVLDGLEAGGVLGVVKHVPGHGRAHADPHGELPLVDASRDALAEDLAPFRALADAPMAMAAHLLYPAWDPLLPASASPAIIAGIVRGEIGFDGLLMSDDLGMGALSGPPGARARAAIAAGCDLALHCSGVGQENEAIAGALGAMTPAASARLERALARIAGKASAQGHEALAAKRDALLAYA
ncbi:MAG: beta-N-acetylhexosaminidase [Sphingomonadales bacterium]|jgi:beta-N-acetylhexosaminidase|nr:beta-N-acetylhexosaminidase [Sphingomonadales bacterium]